MIDIVERLLTAIDDGPLHVTSPNGFRGIRRDGFVFPNHGQLVRTYPQSDGSFADRRGSVSLFDLNTPTREQIDAQWCKCGDIFLRQRVVLVFDRSELAPDLIPNSVARIVVPRERGIYVPYLEAWYPRPVPVSFTRHVLVLSRTNTDSIDVEPFEYDRQIRQIEESLRDVELSND